MTPKWKRGKHLFLFTLEKYLYLRERVSESHVRYFRARAVLDMAIYKGREREDPDSRGTVNMKCRKKTQI